MHASWIFKLILILFKILALPHIIYWLTTILWYVVLEILLNVLENYNSIPCCVHRYFTRNWQPPRSRNPGPNNRTFINGWRLESWLRQTFVIKAESYIFVNEMIQISRYLTSFWAAWRYENEDICYSYLKH